VRFLASETVLRQEVFASLLLAALSIDHGNGRAEGESRCGAAFALVQAEEFVSPRPLRLGIAEREFLTSCPDADEALAKVAARMAAGQIDATAEDVGQALREAGAPYVWPHAWSVSGRGLDAQGAKRRFDAWLATLGQTNHRRCGFASIEDAGSVTYAAVLIDALADLAPLPTRVQRPRWLDVTATMLISATSAKVVVAPPSGTPYNAPTSFDGRRARARVHVDRPGAWKLAVVVDGASGPRPALEADVTVGIESSCPRRQPADESQASGVDPEAALARMIAAARRDASLPALARDAALDALARAHSERMMHSSTLAHDVGDGDPRARLAATMVAVRELGENVAHAASAAEAHRALWDSPSHRENILGTRFDHIGVGTARAADGSLWATEIFARLR
jgi:uncharacterized protein YkwD